MANLFFTLFLSLVGAAVAYPNPETVSGSLTDLRDPAVVKAPDGTYILYGTGVGLPMWTSTDRVNWETAGQVFATAPSATDQFTGTSNGALWAPDITLIDGTYWLYYSASSLGSQTSGIFLATSTTGLSGSFTDKGLVVSTTSADDWNAIDPHLTWQGTTWYLSAGSYWDGIMMIPLDASTGLANGGAMINIAKSSASNQAEEGSWIYLTGGYWYLFASQGVTCCGTTSTYRITVARSSSMTGPYVDEAGVAATAGGGTTILETHDSVYGPGGQSLLTDDDGVAIFYFYYYNDDDTTLGINMLDFSSGWPVVTA